MIPGHDHDQWRMGGDAVSGSNAARLGLHGSSWRRRKHEGASIRRDDRGEPLVDLTADHDEVVGSLHDRRLEPLEQRAQRSRLGAADEVVHREHRRREVVDRERHAGRLEAVHVDHIVVACDRRERSAGWAVPVRFPRRRDEDVVVLVREAAHHVAVNPSPRRPTRAPAGGGRVRRRAPGCPRSTGRATGAPAWPSPDGVARGGARRTPAGGRTGGGGRGRSWDERRPAYSRRHERMRAGHRSRYGRPEGGRRRRIRAHARVVVPSGDDHVRGRWWRRTGPRADVAGGDRSHPGDPGGAAGASP